MFGFKKKVAEKPQVQLKEFSFVQAPGFKGFKKCSLTVHGVAPFPDNTPIIKGVPILFKQYISNGDLSWSVYLGTTKIGALFDEAAIPFNNNMVDAVYLKYEEEIVNREKRLRPRLFIHYKEE